ncbi:MAG: VOC family protein [gamma proteobacterium symbiont of Taylorina sp.]|nr:VOC family protein [gamma proteobacterium symbiont of Taylorina sp.]
MSKKKHQAVIPSRIIYTMIRVGDLDRLIPFYHEVLGMCEVRRETFTKGRFTLVFLGYSDDASNSRVELTYNWDEDSYEHGNGYGHITLEADVFDGKHELLFRFCQYLVAVINPINRINDYIFKFSSGL